jgi:hypothetical protein
MDSVLRRNFLIAVGVLLAGPRTALRWTGISSCVYEEVGSEGMP